MYDESPIEIGYYLLATCFFRDGAYLNMLRRAETCKKLLSATVLSRFQFNRFLRNAPREYPNVNCVTNLSLHNILWRVNNTAPVLESAKWASRETQFTRRKKKKKRVFYQFFTSSLITPFTFAINISKLLIS